jgi:hypothetical protein
MIRPYFAGLLEADSAGLTAGWYVLKTKDSAPNEDWATVVERCDSMDEAYRKVAALNHIVALARSLGR